MERFFFVDGAQQIKITDCQNSKTVYPHDYETVGWEPHDDLLYGLPKKTVFITPPTGRHDVVVGQVLSGATQMPYQLTGTSERSSGIPDYPDNDCNLYVTTDAIEQWKRPDETVYEKVTGPGTPIGPTPDCEKVGGQSVTDWKPVGKTYGCQWVMADRNYPVGNTAMGIYEATQKIVRGDGAIISSQTAQKTGSVFSNSNTYCSPAGGCYGSCKLFPPTAPWWNGLTIPSSPPGSDVSTWLAELGWN